MASYCYNRTINIEGKTATKEKNKRYILYWLPAHKRSKDKCYVWKCVDKNSWEYWEYYCSDGYPGRWPATGPALLGLFMIWLVYTLLLGILSRLKEYFYPLAAKFNKKLLQGVQGDGFLEKSPPGRRRQKERGEKHGG